MLYPREHRRPLLLCLFTLSLLTGGVRAEPYRDAASGTVFPDTVGRLRLGKIEKYETEPGQGGVAVAYVSAGAPVTVYVRRLPPDSPLTTGDALKESLAGIRELETAGNYRDVKISILDEGNVRAGWEGAAFTAKHDGKFVLSWIYCRVRPGFLYKVRATSASATNDKLSADLAALLKAIDGDEAKR